MRFLVGLALCAVWASGQVESAQTLREAAMQHRLAGRLAEARPLLERLAALDPAAANLEDFARVEVALGNLDSAEQSYRRAVEMRRSAQDPRTAIVRTLHRHIEVLASLERYDGAESVFASRPVATNAEESAADFTVLARLYSQRKMWPQAATTWRAVLDFQERAWGIDDVRLAPTLDSLAGVHRSALELTLAEPLLRRALAIRQANRGPASAEVAQTMDELGEVLYGLERFADAEGVFERSLTLWKVLLGPGSAMLALNYDNLAVTKAQLSKYGEAEALYLESLKLRDAEDIRSLQSLGVVRAAQEKYAGAEPLYRRAAAMAEEPQNRTAEGASTVLAEYAELLRKMGRVADARRVDARIAALEGRAPAGPSKAAPVTGKAK